MTKLEFTNLEYTNKNELGYCFNLIEDYNEDRCDVLENLSKDVDGITFHYGYGDDIVSFVSVDSLELLDKVEGLEDFLRSNLGSYEECEEWEE